MESSNRMSWFGLPGGLVSLAVGIGMWWPMILEAGRRASANDLWITLYFLGYVIATTLGIELLRRFFVLRKESRRRAAGLAEPEPQVPDLCKDCKQGHRIPTSIQAFAAFGCWPAIGYLVLVVSILCSAWVAPLLLAPYPSELVHKNVRSASLTMVMLLLLIGWVPTIRTSVLICDHCHRRSHPRPPQLGQSPTSENASDKETGEA